MSISITLIIIIATCIISIVAFGNRELMRKYQFNPYSVLKYKEWHRFFTHGFLHADFIHLFFNMFVLYVFGRNVELFFKAYFGGWGALLFILVYILAICVSVIPTFEKHKHDAWYNGVGASGGVSAIMFAFVLFAPVEQICLYGVLCLPGIIWALVYIGYSVYMGQRGRDNVNHDAHLWGALFGFLFTIALKPALFITFMNQIKAALGMG